jgi:cold shock CspA family protein
MEDRQAGEVVFTSPKGFGYIRGLDLQDQNHVSDFYFHFSNVERKLILRQGDIVSYVVIQSKRFPDRGEAVQIRLSKRVTVQAGPSAKAAL